MAQNVLIQPPQRLLRLRLIMEPDPGEPGEAWGVCNPAAARGRDGELYLFPRAVAQGNYSRIERARVLFDTKGDPCAVERLGYVLEPTEDYETNPTTGGGCEDPRVTFVQPLDLYIMAYTAFSAKGPRLALAVSEDLRSWRRLGMLRFMPGGPVDFNACDNKDGAFFPKAVTDPEGKPALALLHRPLLPPLKGVRDVDIHGMGYRQSIWISYCPLERALGDVSRISEVEGHSLLAVPLEDWEEEKIGGGTPPVCTGHGWLTLYHGVTDEALGLQGPRIRYSAGGLVLDLSDPRKIILRSESPVLEPEALTEREGIVPDVVFPTGVDVREHGRIDVYYGMADTRIGVAKLTVPDRLPQ